MDWPVGVEKERARDFLLRFTCDGGWVVRYKRLGIRCWKG